MSTVATRNEADMLAMLRDRYGESAGNGAAWAFVTKVRDAAGFDAKRTIDALAMSLWPSRGLLLYGFEVKCSRSDWLRELKQPEKAEAFGRMVDFFYLVVADEKIVQPGELPPTWGLLAPRGSKLVQRIEAKPLHDLTPVGDSRGAKAPFPEGVSRSFLAALLRSACRSTVALPEELRAEYSRGFDAGKVDARREAVRFKGDLEIERECRRRFEEAAGVRMESAGDQPWFGNHPPAEVGQALRLVLDGEADEEKIRNRLSSTRRSLEDTLDSVDRALGVLA